MSRKTIGVLLLVLVTLVLAFPIQTPCGHLFYSCATAPDASGTYYTYYEVEPLGVTLFETAIGTNLHLFYWSGSDGHTIRK